MGPLSLNLMYTVVILIYTNVLGTDSQFNNDENEAKAYMKKLNSELLKQENRIVLATWDQNTNKSSITEQKLEDVTLECNQEKQELLAPLYGFNWRGFQDEELRKQFEYYIKDDDHILPEENTNATSFLENILINNYQDFKVCHFIDREKCDLDYNTGILPITSKSKNPEELKYYWIELHKMGAAVKNDYAEFVKFENEAARLMNFTSVAEFWLKEYNQDGFEDEMLKLWTELQPLYLQLHAYVRKRLFDQYGPEIVNRKGPIPVQLLGDLLGQYFNSIESFTRPFGRKHSINISEKLLKKNFTAMEIFRMAEDFFVSIDFPKMTDFFWQNSIFEEPKDGRRYDCTPTAYNFFDNEDFRVSMCTQMDQINYEIVFHEMGYIETLMLQKDLPLMKKGSPIAEIDSAIGGAIALSVMSTKHLKSIGLMEEETFDNESELNDLFNKASTRIAFLPFVLMIEMYRHSIFREETKPKDYNCHYWKLRENLQGVEPPVKRTEADFDAPTLFHFSHNKESLRYYVGFLLAFQFHAALCEKAGQYVPGSNKTKLSDCDIYGSTEAGNAFKAMLSQGSSFPWPETIELLTGQRKIDTKGILEYFSPLKTWLEQENNRTGEYIGWVKSTVEFCTAEQEVEFEKTKISKLLIK